MLESNSRFLNFFGIFFSFFDYWKFWNLISLCYLLDCLSFLREFIKKKKKFKQILDSIIEYFSNYISFFCSINFLKSDSIFLQSNDFYKSIKTLPLFAYFRFLMIGWIVYILLYISLNSLPATMIITISKVCKESEYVKTLYHPDRKPLPTVSLVKENILVLHTGYKMAYIKFWSTFDKELCTVSNKISHIYIYKIFP